LNANERWIGFSEDDAENKCAGGAWFNIALGQRNPPVVMPPLEEIKQRIEAAISAAKLEIVPNGSPSQQSSLRIDHEHAVAVAKFLRDDPALRLDFCSNVTGIDWLDRTIKTTTKVKTVVDGVEKEIAQTTEEKIPGYLEAVYHLYSMALKHGPVIIRMRTADRAEGVRLPSLTPIWRSAELQEREIFDLYGIHFENHPDLRRILMWDEFKDHPMRKDYVPPDDFEWEPTPHEEVLERAKEHYPNRPAVDGAEQIRATD
jgi:NADH-quinone oxidoreductase subunit C